MLTYLHKIHNLHTIHNLHKIRNHIIKPTVRQVEFNKEQSIDICFNMVSMNMEQPTQAVAP